MKYETFQGVKNKPKGNFSTKSLPILVSAGQGIGKHKCFSPITTIDDLCDEHFLMWLIDKESNPLLWDEFHNWTANISSSCG